MCRLTFAWDKEKDRASQRKHRISFAEARSVFYNENAREYSDPDHSEGEEPFILLGVSSRLRVLVACHCYRESESVIRIISARRAQRSGEETYWSRNT
jgi:uncharacterized DUF497 family protein